MIAAFAQAAASTTTTTASVNDACGAAPGVFCRVAYDRLGPTAASGVSWLEKPFDVLVIIVVAFVVNRIAHVLIKRTMNRVLSEPSQRTRQAIRKATPNLLLKTAPLNLRIEARVQTLTAVMRSIVSVVIWFVAVIAILGTVTDNLTTLVAPASIIGVALGFGAQNVVKDFLAGIFIVIEDQFGVGDVVDIGGEAKGTVEQLTLRATRVRDVHGTVWHVPNGQILRAANKSQEWARALLDIEVDGSTDYERVAALVHRVAENVAADERWMIEIIETPELWGVESFTEKGYTVRLVVKTRPASQFGVMRELRIRLLAAFREAGIILPGGQWSTEHYDALAATGYPPVGLSGAAPARAPEDSSSSAPPAGPAAAETKPNAKANTESAEGDDVASGRISAENRTLDPHPPRGDPDGTG